MVAFTTVTAIVTTVLAVGLKLSVAVNVILFVPKLQGAPVIVTLAVEVVPLVVETVALHKPLVLILVETV